MKNYAGLVSVIIPCYNNAKYLKKCIDSVLNQTYSNFEVIIVDDGSDDNPESIICQYSDSRIKPIILLPHNGVSASRNEGIEHSKGEYIIFIDGDDWIEPDHIACLVESSVDSQCSMILMSVDYPDHSESKSTKALSCHSFAGFSKDKFHLLFEDYLLSSPCNKLYRSELINKFNIRFDPSISYAEDLLFNLEYFSVIQTAVIKNSTTYHYVKHSISGTTRFHKTPAYTLSKISFAAHRLFGDNQTKETKIVLLRHYVWGIINLMHKDSTLNTTETVEEIKKIVRLKEFKENKTCIPFLGLNRGFQLLLKIGNPWLIYHILSVQFKIR